MIPLRQSTASQEVLLGPFLDDTDGKTAETALTIANTDIKVWKHGGTTEASKNSGGATHIASGRYYAVLDATDTDTVGALELNVHVAGALPVKVRCTVLEEAVFDALYAASAPGYVANAPVNVAQFGGSAGTFAGGRPEVNVSHFGGSAGSFSGGAPGVYVAFLEAGVITEAAYDTTAGSFAPHGIIDQGTAQSASGNDVVLRAASAFPDNNLVGKTLAVRGSTQGYWQSALITSNVLATDTVTISPPTGWVTPSGTITYKIHASAPGATLTEIGTAVWATTTRTVTAIDEDTTTLDLDATIRGAVGLASANLDTQLTAIDDYLDTEVAAIKAKTDNLPSDPADASDIASSFSSLSTAITTIDDFLDTEVAAIKAKTDQLTFTSANKVDATLQAAGDFAQAAADKVWSSTTRTLTSSGGVRKNTALAAFPFRMADSTDHVTGKTGLTVAATRSLDGAAFAACANSVTEVANGVYKIDLAAADLNADTVTLKFAGTGADDTIVTIKTAP
jgi:hypothetical protein